MIENTLPPDKIVYKVTIESHNSGLQYIIRELRVARGQSCHGNQYEYITHDGPRFWQSELGISVFTSKDELLKAFEKDFPRIVSMNKRMTCLYYKMQLKSGNLHVYVDSAGKEYYFDSSSQQLYDKHPDRTDAKPLFLDTFEFNK